jgi:hypothetical protein
VLRNNIVICTKFPERMHEKILAIALYSGNFIILNAVQLFANTDPFRESTPELKI